MQPQLSKFRILFAAALLSSCGKQGPEVDVCISRPLSGGFVCVDQKQQVYEKPYVESDKYVAFSPNDARKILESCNIGASERALVVNYLSLVEKMTVTQNRTHEREAVTDGGSL